ncbi:bis(5'-adenosyl)-triphosphatase enpp4-like [Mercenaria mercenaria]|uniref:bis(5'-adenosyl)-triphosphatase enpp4-like n=1 Tax=Mercenaria mercenaria TaxID=6596 RepID=UPI00234F5EE5|nr:bis(5'-adenosyl)-triphosphatase enpp4-like [Mercenaria mercenaria]
MTFKASFSILSIFIWTVIDASKVLVISMDGFRWDYIGKAKTPVFDEFAAKGTRAVYINPTFVTKSLPCHYSMATGLYEESHGIIANSMYDQEFDETFNYKTIDTKWWDGGEPVWITAGKQGKKTGIYFWHGSETEIQGLRPDFYYAYNRSVPFKERVDTVVQWLSNSTFDIDLAMLYFYQPDRTGHLYGPNSSEVISKVEEMDAILGYLVRELDKTEMLDKINIIVTSDHGMAEIDYTNRRIDVSDYIDMTAILHIPAAGPVANILPKANMIETVFQNLSRAPHMKVYRKEEIPNRWHYKNHRRVLPILAVADEGWMIVKGPEDYKNEKGAHGYDNELSSMKPIFYARGPNVKSGYEASPFNSVDIYPLMCELLGIEPAANNGTLDIVQNFIVKETSGVSSSEISSVSTITLCVLVRVLIELEKN